MQIKHKLISLAFLIACLCLANPTSAQNKLVQIFIQKSDGKTRTLDNGQKYPGYRVVQVLENQTAHQHTIRIICSGKGWDMCPDGDDVVMNRVITMSTYETMVAKIERDIDLNQANGRFYMDGWYCVWENGSKSYDVETSTYVYNYNLMIQSEVPAIFVGAVSNQ